MKIYKEAFIESPLGIVRITSAVDKIVAVHFMTSGRGKKSDSNPALKEASNQLEKYFSGKLKKFDLPIYLGGTEFQVKVWSILLKIPFGDTISYLELAKKLGDVKCIRAAAGANGKNPLTVIVPCHRVIGSDGKLVGYGGELWRKDWLIKHEKKQTGQYMELF